MRVALFVGLSGVAGLIAFGTAGSRWNSLPPGGSPSVTETSRPPLPRLETIREESARSPHAPAESFVAFATEVARLREDPKEWGRLADRLEEAAREADYPPVRAFSLRVFRSLARATLPDRALEDRLFRLERELPTEIVALSNL